MIIVLTIRHISSKQIENLRKNYTDEFEKIIIRRTKKIY